MSDKGLLAKRDKSSSRNFMMMTKTGRKGTTWGLTSFPKGQDIKVAHNSIIVDCGPHIQLWSSIVTISKPLWTTVFHGPGVLLENMESPASLRSFSGQCWHMGKHECIGPLENQRTVMESCNATWQFNQVWWEPCNWGPHKKAGTPFPKLLTNS